MSKIFTPKEVRNQHVPRVDAFQPLAKKYQLWLPRQCWFEGGVLLGSVLQGTQTRRSDIDLFVVFTERYGQEATRALANFRRTHAGYIPVNINLWGARELIDGFHTVGHGFLAHLKWAVEHDGLIGGNNPIPHIKLRKRHGAQEDLESYIAKKVKRLREFSCEHGRWTERRCKALEDVGMASVHATRRWLSLHGHADSTLHRKEAVAMLLARYSPSSGEKLRALIAADTAYEVALNDNITNRYDYGAYVRALEELSRHVGDAATFLAGLAEHSRA